MIDITGTNNLNYKHNNTNDNLTNPIERTDPIDTVHTVFANTTSNEYSTISIDSTLINTHTVVLTNINIAYMIQS